MFLNFKKWWQKGPENCKELGAVRHLAVHLEKMERTPMRNRATIKVQKITQEQLEVRIPKALKRLLEHAASLRGTRLTDFVLASAQKEAAQTIKNFEMLALCNEAREVFVNALLKPPAPNTALRKAADRYKKHVGDRSI